MSNVLSNLAAFIVALGVIIFVHEAGHLLMAKAFGMRVLTFSLGFGKRIWGFTRNETEYKVSLIPLGGYVRLGGEDPGEVSDDPRDFMNTPRWQRILVYLAGPAMNVILAILLIAGVLMVGIQVPTLPEIPPIIGSVAAESPAEAAGLLPGDEVLTANGKAAEDWEDVHFAFITSPERQVDLTVLRQGQERQVSLVPVKVPKYEFGYAGAFPTVLPRIAQVLADSPAEAAGFQPGDEIRSVDGQAIAQWQEFVDYIEAHADQSVAVEVLREQQPALLHVVPRDEGGKGRIGVAHGYYQQLGPGAALVESVRYNWQITRQTLSVLGQDRYRPVGGQERPLRSHRNCGTERSGRPDGTQAPGAVDGSDQYQHRDSESLADPGAGRGSDHDSHVRRSATKGPLAAVPRRESTRWASSSS